MNGPAADVRAAAQALAADRLVVLPTDTVYGVAVRAARPDAAGALAEAKGRPERQPIAVLVADAGQAASVGVLDGRASALADAFWPGPLTLVVPRREGLMWDLGEPATTVGIRRPDHDVIAHLAETVGPLAVTSANRHGEPTPAEAVEAADRLVGEVAVVLDRGPLRGNASTVVDLVGPDVTVLREGAIDEGELAAVLARPAPERDR